MSILFKGNLEEGNYTLIKSTDGWVLKGETSYVGFNFADRKTEPQKKEVEWVYNKRERLWYPYSNGELLFKDEPTTQTETQNSNLTFEKADERCKGCKHYKLTCDLFSEICKYEPKTEPQTDCAWK